MIGSLVIRVSVVVLLVGMLAGVTMGDEQNFVLAPTHAHLNLVGGVLLFLFGLYYRLVPAAAENSLAKWQGWLHIIGAIVFPVGVGIVVTQGDALVVIPIVGSLIVVAAIILFTVIVFRDHLDRPRGHILRPIRGIVRGTDSPSATTRETHEEICLNH